MGEATVRQLAEIFSSEIWWKPILGFMFTNCGKFTEKIHTHEEYSVFCQLRTMVVDLLDTSVCKQISMRPNQLENFLFESSANGNSQVISILKILNDLTDFCKVKTRMLTISQYIEDFTTQQMIELQSKSVSDDNEDVDDIVAMLEKGEEAALLEETKKTCYEMRQKLKPDPSVPIISSSPPPRSILGQALASSRGSGSSSKFNLNKRPTIQSINHGPMIMRPKIYK